MDTSSTIPETVNARTLLLPYAAAVTAAMAGVQIAIAMSGGQIGVLAAVLTGLVAIGIAGWVWRSSARLRQVRFGVAVAHAIAYVAVTTSFNLHAIVRTLTLGSGPDGFDAAARNLLASPWFGATLVMSAAWGVGLLIHLTGAVLGRGWED